MKTSFKTRKWLSAAGLLLAVSAVQVFGQPILRQATDAEVTSGANVKAYVNPRQVPLGGTGPTNGQTAAQVRAIVKDTNDNLTLPAVAVKINTLSNAIPTGISLKAFGAVGDGTTDDTAAVQAWANYICSTNVMGIVTPASGAGYVITSAIGFSNTCQITAQGGGVNYGASDYALTKCKFIQTARGAGGFYFTNYADALDVSKITIVNSQAGNFTNANSYGFYFTGAVGSHMNMFTHLGTTNFGKGYYPVDLAIATFKACAGQYNGVGFEVTNINAFDFPIKLDSCLFSLNYSNGVSCSSATVQSFIVENCILFASTPAHNFYSVANNTTLIGNSFAAFTTNTSIEIGGGTVNLIGDTIIPAGGNPLAGRYSIAATNCNLNIASQLDSSNALNNCSTYLYGSGSKLFAQPATDVVWNNGSGMITTNRAVNTLSFSGAAFNGITASQVGGLLATTNLAVSSYASFDVNTNLTSTINGNLWTNLDTHFTNYGATTNIVLPADGNRWTVLATNGPHLFLSFGGNNMGAVSVWTTTNGDTQWPPQVQMLGYSNHLTTNCILDFQPFGGTNKVLGGQSEL